MIVVYLVNLASHVTTHDLIGQGMIYPLEADYITVTWRSGRGLARLELRPLYQNGQASWHWVKIEWIATSNQVRKYNTTSNRQ